MLSIKAIVLVVIIQTTKSQLVGKSCVTNLDKSGTCTRLLKCPEAVLNVHTGELPKFCGFLGIVPAICCENVPRPRTQTRSGESVARRKCEEYKSRSIWTTISNYVSSSWKNGGFGLIGSVDAFPLEFPHMAVLGYGPSKDIRWDCGGSLISEKFVLTAAHCCITSKMKNLEYIKLGAHKLSGPEQLFGVKKIFKHPNYTSSQNYHDIALIELDRPANIRSDVRPACLQVTKDLPSHNFIATGWGAVEVYGNNQDTLQKVNLTYVPFDDCGSYYTYQRSLNSGIVDDWQICADGGEEVADTCQGDSGGPLQIKSDDSSLYTIVGITSFGIKCGVVPGVYTRVSNYVTWIESIAWPEESK